MSPTLCLGALQVIQSIPQFREGNFSHQLALFFSQESKEIALASGSDLPLNKIWPFKESL